MSGFSDKELQDNLDIFFEFFRTDKSNHKYGIFKDNIRTRKEFIKHFIKVYKYCGQHIIKEYGEDIVFNISRITNLTEIPKITEYLLFKPDIDNNKIIKYIKTCDISYLQLMTVGKILVDTYTSIAEEYDVNNIKQLSILCLNTVLLIRIIKFNFDNTDIVTVDNKGNLKKRISNEKIILVQIQSGDTKTEPYSGLIKVCRKPDISISNIKFLLKPLEKSNEFSKLSRPNLLKAYPILIHKGIQLNLNYDYAKAILKEEYLELVDISNLANDTWFISDTKVETFFNRKILIPNGGVVLLITNKNSFLESIYINEYTFDNFTSIITISRYRDGKEAVNAIHLEEGIKTTPVVFYDRPDPSMPNDFKQTHISNYIFNFLGTYPNWYDTSRAEEAIDFIVISPYYWKYRHKDYSSYGDIKDKNGVVIKREFEVNVGAFLRKIDGTASKEAKEYAHKICLNLEEGYTVVRPHIRTYNKIK